MALINPYSANVIVALHMSGADGSTDFIDSSGISKTFTANGNARISTAQSKFNGSSGYFDGSGDYLLCTDTSARLSSGNHSISFWFYPTVTPTSSMCLWSQYYAGGTGRAYMSFNASRQCIAQLGSSYVTSSGSYSLNTWHYFKWDRSGTTNSISVDGSLIGSFTSSTAFENCKMRIGCANSGTDESPVLSSYFTGYISDLIIYKDVAISGISPPTETFYIDPITGLYLPKIARPDLQDGGHYHISLNVDEMGLPGAYRTRLYDRYSGRMVREQWSGADGIVDFQSIAYREAGYYATAHDHTDPLREASIADFLTPELMTA